MKRFYLVLGVTILSLAQVSPSYAQKNELFNSAFKSGISGWHGIGTVVYLKPDGKESPIYVKDAVPVLKIPLKPTETREISQEFTTSDEPTELHTHLEIRASSDFKSDIVQDDNSGWKSGAAKGAHNAEGPQSDFWVLIGPDSRCHTANASRKWTTIDYTVKNVIATRYRMITFCVPCGKGSIYIRNTEVSTPPKP